MFEVSFIVQNGTKNMIKKIVFYIFAFELYAVSSPFYEENTCHWHSMC